MSRATEQCLELNSDSAHVPSLLKRNVTGVGGGMAGSLTLLGYSIIGIPRKTNADRTVLNLIPGVFFKK